jgi:geranylgeranyl diphosphate synthase, type II
MINRFSKHRGYAPHLTQAGRVGSTAMDRLAPSSMAAALVARSSARLEPPPRALGARNPVTLSRGGCGVHNLAVAHDASLVGALLGEARTLVLAEIQRAIADRRRQGYEPLYDQLTAYPFREGKGLRPAIVLSACRGVGGRTDQAIISATAVELFHNAFLVHDDIEDGSEFRRGLITLPEEFGVPTAINVGDATNVLAIGLLLENVQTLGVRKALLVIREIERMARESVEGQAIELDWIRLRRFDLTDHDYVRMAYKKTCWYTVIAPLRMGVIAGSAPGVRAPSEDELRPLIGLGFLAGIAFQIQDDVLNLVGDPHLYGKELAGDLWEGKRTVMLNHFISHASPAERERAIRLLNVDRRAKDGAEVAWLGEAMRERGSIAHGKRLASEYCERALEADDRIDLFRVDGVDRDFLREMLAYVIDRIT